MKKLSKLLILPSVALAILLSSGCASTTLVCVKVPLPPKPDLPVLTPEQDDALWRDHNTSYVILVDRDAKQSAHIDRVHSIVDKHNVACK